jgi:hypothetical protein
MNGCTLRRDLASESNFSLSPTIGSSRSRFDFATKLQLVDLRARFQSSLGAAPEDRVPHLWKQSSGKVRSHDLARTVLAKLLSLVAGALGEE